MMRAKMRVSKVERVTATAGPDAGKTTSETVAFQCVCKSDGYPPDGTDENNSFARWTPYGEARYGITNPALFDKFEEGQTYYVDFTPAA